MQVDPNVSGVNLNLDKDDTVVVSSIKSLVSTPVGTDSFTISNASQSPNLSFSIPSGTCLALSDIWIDIDVSFAANAAGTFNVFRTDRFALSGLTCNYGSSPIFSIPSRLDSYVKAIRRMVKPLKDYDAPVCASNLIITGSHLAADYSRANAAQIEAGLRDSALLTNLGAITSQTAFLNGTANDSSINHQEVAVPHAAATASPNVVFRCKLSDIYYSVFDSPEPIYLHQELSFDCTVQALNRLVFGSLNTGAAAAIQPGGVTLNGVTLNYLKESNTNVVKSLMSSPIQIRRVCGFNQKEYAMNTASRSMDINSTTIPDRVLGFMVYKEAAETVNLGSFNNGYNLGNVLVTSCMPKLGNTQRSTNAIPAEKFRDFMLCYLPDSLNSSVQCQKQVCLLDLLSGSHGARHNVTGIRCGNNPVNYSFQVNGSASGKVFGVCLYNYVLELSQTDAKFSKELDAPP